MEDDRIKWNRRFEEEDSFLGERPSPFLMREIERIKRLSPGVRALDIASGEGRNSIFLATHGFRVTALDISDVGIAKGRQWADEVGVEIDFRRVDLDCYHITESFDLIINFNFLLRSLIPEEVAALVPGGLLLFDTILESPQLLASHKPGYLLRRGELVRIFTAFDGEILFAEEEELEDEELRQGNMPTARLFFRNASR